MKPEASMDKSVPSLRRKFMFAAPLLPTMALGVMFLLWPKQPTPPSIGSEFLGFANTLPGLAARFSITNYPEDDMFPVVVETALRENGVWTPMPKPAGGWPFLQFSIGGQPHVV